MEISSLFIQTNQTMDQDSVQKYHLLSHRVLMRYERFIFICLGIELNMEYYSILYILQETLYHSIYYPKSSFIEIELFFICLGIL